VSARTSLSAVIVAIGAAILTLLVTLAVATGAAPSAKPVVATTQTHQSGVHPNTADREQKPAPDAVTQSRPDSTRVVHLSGDWSSYRSAER
jgi:hypothetical protein